MADDKDKDSTSGSDLPSADGTPGDLPVGPIPVDGAMHEASSDDTAVDHPVELGSESDEGEPFASDPAEDESDTDGAQGDPDAGDDVPEELREDSDPDEADPRDTEPSDAELSSAELRDTDLDGSDPSDPDLGDDRELVSVGAPSRTASAGDDTSAGSARGRVKKDKATPKQGGEVEKEHRTGPVKFLKESAGELRKVVYPTGQQLAQYFVVVLIFVLFIIGIVSLLDLGFGWAIFKIFA